MSCVCAALVCLRYAVRQRQELDIRMPSTRRTGRRYRLGGRHRDGRRGQYHEVRYGSDSDADIDTLNRALCEASRTGHHGGWSCLVIWGVVRVHEEPGDSAAGT
jgi:hypothetical protein